MSKTKDIAAVTEDQPQQESTAIIAAEQLEQTIEAQPQQSAKTIEKQAPKFSISRLRQNCVELFGITSSTYDGAVHKLDGEFTVDEMKIHIKKWQGTAACPAKKEGK